MTLKFTYGDVPEEPTVPYTSVAFHSPHDDCQLGHLFLMIFADFGSSPIHYDLYDFDTGDMIKNPSEHLRKLIEFQLSMNFYQHMQFRN